MVKTTHHDVDLLSSIFRQRLLDWHRRVNNRQMPWKGIADPYKIWLSEIILQQTRVDQGMAYYEKFVRHYPTILDLAAADDDQVFKHWEGLGYYSRCKNLLHTARVVADAYQGVFPSNYEQILALKGVGPYTAAAIAAFAFNLPYAVLDGNVFRVLSRVFAVWEPTDSTQGKTRFKELAGSTLSRQEPAAYNQAIMDFGATVCTPQRPQCSSCPMGDICLARLRAEVGSLPRKEKVLKKKNRFITWLILEITSSGLIYLQKRPAGDIWENLHEYYPTESESRPEWTDDLVSGLVTDLLDVTPVSVKSLGAATQQLTHQKIHGYFYLVHVDKRPAGLPAEGWVTKAAAQELAFPKLLKALNTTLL